MNLFDINGIAYTDNIPDNTKIGITKEQYCEYTQLKEKNKKLEDSLKEIKQHIRNKIKKSFDYDYGIGGSSSDRLFTETIIELDLIENMIDEALGVKND